MRPAVGGTLPVLALVEGDEEEEDLSAEEKRLSAPLASFRIRGCSLTPFGTLATIQCH